MTRTRKDEPGGGRFSCATPMDATMIQLLGSGGSFEGVTFTRDQLDRLTRVYGYSPEQTERDVEESIAAHAEALRKQAEEDAKKPSWQRKAKATRPATAGELRTFYKAGGHLQVLRNAGHDGLRLVAFLSRYLEPDEDPVKMVVRLATEAGYDVDSDVVAWAFEDE